MHGGAQLPHGGCGMQSVPDDVAHDQRHPGARQGDDVEPVAADCLRGEVTGSDLDGVLFGQRAGQQSPLQRHGQAVLAGVAACVVEGHGGSGGQFGREGQIVLIEGLGLLGAPEVDDAQQHAAGGQRRRDERMDPVADDAGAPRGVHLLPSRGITQTRHQDRLSALDAAGLWRGRPESDQVTDGEEGSVVADTGDGHALHPLAAGDYAVHPQFLIAQHGLGQVDGDVVGEARNRDLRQLLGCTGHIEGGADAAGRVVEQLQPPPDQLDPLRRLADHLHHFIGADLLLSGHRGDRKPRGRGAYRTNELGFRVMDQPRRRFGRR